MKGRCHMAGLLLLRAWNSCVHGLRWPLLSMEKQGDDMEGWKDGMKTNYEICSPQLLAVCMIVCIENFSSESLPPFARLLNIFALVSDISKVQLTSGLGNSTRYLLVAQLSRSILFSTTDSIRVASAEQESFLVIMFTTGTHRIWHYIACNHFLSKIMNGAVVCLHRLRSSTLFGVCGKLVRHHHYFEKLA